MPSQGFFCLCHVQEGQPQAVLGKHQTQASASQEAMGWVGFA